MPSAPIRQLLAGMWLTGIVGGVLDFALESRLPSHLQAYLAAELERPFEWTDAMLALLALVSFGFTVYSSIQLYRLRLEGREPFAVGFAAGLVALLFFGPAVYNPWAAALYAASYSLGGALIGWLYLPPRSGADHPAV